MGKDLSKAAPPAAMYGGAEPVLDHPRGTTPATVRYEFSPEFHLTWAPRRYQTDADGNVVMNLGKLPKEPGINGINAHGSDTVARAALQDRGERIIPRSACHAEDTPDGKPSYLRRTLTSGGPGKPDRWHYHTAWERLEVHAGRGVIVPIAPEMYRAWLDKLVERGIVPPCHESVIRGLRDTVEAAYHTASERDSVGGRRNAALSKIQLDKINARLEAGA